VFVGILGPTGSWLALDRRHLRPYYALTEGQRGARSLMLGRFGRR
jgi:hypothetical protein